MALIGSAPEAIVGTVREGIGGLDSTTGENYTTMLDGSTGAETTGLDISTGLDTTTGAGEG
jgi:hypothetical protein